MRLILLLFPFLLVFSVAQAQIPDEDSTASPDIYDLYKDSIFAGDHRVIEAGDYQVSNYRFHFTEVYRMENEGLIGIMIKAYSNVSGRTYFFAVPIPGNGNNYPYEEQFSELLIKAGNELDEYMTTAFLAAFIRYYGDHRDLSYQMGTKYYSAYQALQQKKINRLEKKGVEVDKSPEEMNTGGE